MFFEYQSFELVLHKIAFKLKDSHSKVIAMPMIGCGLAGGDENKILEIMDKFNDMIKDQHTLKVVIKV